MISCLSTSPVPNPESPARMTTVPRGQQPAHVSKQSRLLTSIAMPANAPDQCPGNRNGSLEISQSNNQQLMSKPDFRFTQNQSDFAYAAF